MSCACYRTKVDPIISTILQANAFRRKIYWAGPDHTHEIHNIDRPYLYLSDVNHRYQLFSGIPPHITSVSVSNLFFLQKLKELGSQV